MYAFPNPSPRQVKRNCLIQNTLFHPSLMVFPQGTRTLWGLILAHQSLQLKFLRISDLPRICSSCMSIYSRQALWPFGVLGWDWWQGVAGIEVEEHVDEEKDQKGEAVENEDVGYMRDAGIRDELHLFFGGTHEEQAGCVE